MIISPSALWIVLSILQIVAAVLAGRSETTPRYFKAYLYFEAFSFPVAFVIHQYVGGMAYFYTFYAVAIVTDLLTFLLAYEIYYLVFGPRAALPDLVPERAGALVAMAFSGAAALGVFIPPILGGPLTRSMLLTEQIMTAGTWGTFFVLISYSLILRINWPRRIAGITLGFVLYLTIDVFAVFVRARGGYQLAAVAGEVGKTAYLLALVWWTCVLWRKESAPLPATSGEVAVMKHFHRQSMEALRRAGVLR